MTFSIRSWGLGLAAVTVLGFSMSAMADGPVAGPVDGGGPAIAAAPGGAGPAGAIDAALDAVGAVEVLPAAGGAPIAGGPVDGAVIEEAVVPVGPPILHHFVNVIRFPGYKQIVEIRHELILHGDNTFKMLLPNDRHCGPWGCNKADDAPIALVGTWALNDDELMLTYEEGWMDMGWMTVGAKGPQLRFQGRRWGDILPAPVAAVAPVGAVAPVAGPVGGIPQ